MMVRSIGICLLESILWLALSGGEEEGRFLHARMHGPIRARTEIPSQSSACYLGSLRIEFQDDLRGPYKISVIDELEEASAALAQRFAQFKD